MPKTVKRPSSSAKSATVAVSDPIVYTRTVGFRIFNGALLAATCVLWSLDFNTVLADHHMSTSDIVFTVLSILILLKGGSYLLAQSVGRTVTVDFNTRSVTVRTGWSAVKMRERVYQLADIEGVALIDLPLSRLVLIRKIDKKRIIELTDWGSRLGKIGPVGEDLATQLRLPFLGLTHRRWSDL
jgi:hypothetical protein